MNTAPLPPATTLVLLPGHAPAPGGGRLKARPEDFVVEEIPAYAPCGEGAHLYLWIEKVDVSGPELVRHVSRRLGVAAADIGVAGMKDRRAVTRQWVSVPAAGVADPRAVDGRLGERGRIALREVSRHGNKLRTGHLAGNRFEIRVTGRAAEHDEAARAALAAASRDGFANTFGAQRFGGGDTVEVGQRIVAGGRVDDRRMRRLGVSALQSWVFNRWLELRAGRGLIGTALAGDVLKRRATGGLFTCEAAEEDTARLQAGELVVTGPIHGGKMRRAGGAAAALEDESLAEAGLTAADFAQLGRLAPGTRRAALAWPGEASMRREEDGLLVGFTLPRGTYATVLLATVLGADLEEIAAEGA